MIIEQAKKDYFKNMFFKAARLPAIYLVTGIVLVTLSAIDIFFPITQYKQIFEITDQIGKIFLVLSGLAFAYRFLVLTFQHFERSLMEQHAVASLILASVRRSLRIVYTLVALNIIISMMPTSTLLMYANEALNIIIIASIGWIAIQILYTIEAIIFQQTTLSNKKESTRAKALYTKTHILRNIATIVIILVTVACILMTFNSVRNIGISLLASAGLLTAIMGFASQKALFSLFSGLQIALAQPIRIGDIVVIENETGIIEEITFTYVTMKLCDGRRMVLPISYFIEKHFINWSHDPDGMRSSISFHVDYMMPIEPLRAHLNAILSRSKFWDQGTGKLHVAKLVERSVELQILVSAANENDLADLRSEIREKVLEYIRENYPQYFPVLRFNANGDAA